MPTNQIKQESTCTCSNFVTSGGYGNCEKYFWGQPLCWASEKSDCYDSIFYEGLGKNRSFEACSSTFGKVIANRIRLTPSNTNTICSFVDSMISHFKILSWQTLFLRVWKWKERTKYNTLWGEWSVSKSHKMRNRWDLHWSLQRRKIYSRNSFFM